jgi:hypothetical protein
MPVPEVWGPAVWSLFHTLAEKVNENAYPYIAKQLFNLIVRICRFLPCPECSIDASNFLAKIRIENLKTKADFKQTFYLFHNYVNAKKRKPMFNFGSLSVYQRYRLVPIVNNFISCYNTKGNMKLLNESFQRQFVLKDFRSWFSANIKAFFTPVNPPANIVSVLPPVSSEEEVVVPLEEEVVLVEEEVVVPLEKEVVLVEEEEVVVPLEEQIVSSQEIAVEEEAVVEEEVVVSSEEIAVEEEALVEEEQIVLVEEQIVSSEEEEQIVSSEEMVVEEEVVVTTKQNKKKKKKKT